MVNNDNPTTEKQGPSPGSMACAVFSGCALLSVALFAFIVMPIAGLVYYSGKENSKREAQRRYERKRRYEQREKERLKREKKLAQERKVRREAAEARKAKIRRRLAMATKKPTNMATKTAASSRPKATPPLRSSSEFRLRMKKKRSEEKKARARLYQNLCFLNQTRLLKALEKQEPKPKKGPLERKLVNELISKGLLPERFSDPGQRSGTFGHYYLFEHNGKVAVICSSHGSQDYPEEFRETNSPKAQALALGLGEASAEKFSRLSPLKVGSYSTPHLMQTWVLRIDEQGQELWRKVYMQARRLSSIGAVSSQDGFIVACHDGRMGTLGTTVYYQGLDKSGNALWKRSYSGLKLRRVFSMIAAPKGGFILAGAAGRKSRGLQTGLVSRFSASGNKMWEKRLGEGRKDIITATHITNDGELVAVGYHGRHPYMASLQLADGKIRWQQTFHSVRHGKLYSVTQNKDGQLCTLGTVYTKGKAGPEFWFMGLTDKGAIDWQYRIGASRRNEPSRVVPLWTGDFLSSGTVMESFRGAKQMWIHSFSSKGKAIIQSGFKGDRVDDVAPASDGGYIVAGTTREFAMGKRDVWLIKFDKNNKILWQRTVGGENDERPCSIRSCLDGGYIVAGESAYAGLSEREAENVQINAQLEVPFVYTDTVMETAKTTFQEAKTEAIVQKLELPANQ